MEIWRQVKGYEGRYFVSDHGRVKNARDLVMSPERHYRGYLKVDLCKTGVCKKLFIHRLVAIAFLPGFDPVEVVNHIDGDKTNNHMSNLEWMSSADNTRHYFDRVRRMEEEEAF